MKYRSAFLGIGSALALLQAPPAFAQWSPSGTANFGAGLGATALSQSILSGTRTIGRTSPPPQNPDQPGNAARAAQQAANPHQRLVHEIWLQLRPEYERRERLYGKSEADRWLVESAREIGRQAGERAREARSAR